MAFLEKMEKMMFNLPHQNQIDRIREERKEVWHDYQEQLKLNPEHKTPPSIAPWWVPVMAPKSMAEAKYVNVSQSFLASLTLHS